MMKHYSAVGASAYLYDNYGITRSAKTLGNLRTNGGGPRYIRVTPREVVYRQDDLEAWAQSLIGASVENTAQEAAA